MSRQHRAGGGEGGSIYVEHRGLAGDSGVGSGSDGGDGRGSSGDQVVVSIYLSIYLHISIYIAI